MSQRDRRIIIVMIIIALMLTTACTTGVDTASDATKTPTPTQAPTATQSPTPTETPEPTHTPEPTPIPYQADMVHTEKLDTMIDALELYHEKDEFSDMGNVAYQDFLASIDPDFICNYEGVGRVGKNLTYIVATRKEVAPEEEFDLSEEHFARFKGKVYYVKTLDLLIAIPYRHGLKGGSCSTWVYRGISNYLCDIKFEYKVSRKNKYGISYRGYDDYNIHMYRCGYGNIYINDFDFEKFYQDFHEQAKTSKKCSEYNRTTVRMYNNADDDVESLHFGISDSGEKVVDGYINEELFDRVMDKIRRSAGFKYHIKDDITDITSATLRVNGKKYTVTDINTLDMLEMMIQRSRKTDFDHLCLPNGTISIVNKGKRITLFLESDIFSIGSGCIYTCRWNDDLSDLFDVDKDEFYIEIDRMDARLEEVKLDIVEIK